jgi:hypothetical protein
VSEKSITRQHAGRFRRAKNEPSAPRSLAGGCCGHKFLESRDEGELGYASLESKSEILVQYLQCATCHVLASDLRSPWRRSRNSLPSRLRAFQDSGIGFGNAIGEDSSTRVTYAITLAGIQTGYLPRCGTIIRPLVLWRQGTHVSRNPAMARRSRRFSGSHAAMRSNLQDARAFDLRAFSIYFTYSCTSRSTILFALAVSLML